MTSPIRVLHLEDSSRDAEMIQDKLDVDGIRCDIALVDSKDSFEAALMRESFDLILSDYNLPGYDGTSAIERAQECQPDTPVIVISGSLGEDEAVKCLHNGATDYLLKQRLDRLGPAVRRAIHEAGERRGRKDAEQALLQRERRLSSIYETVADVLFYVEVEKDGRYRFTSINQAFASTTGLDYNQVVGKRVDEVIPEPSLTAVLEKYAEAIRERRVVRWEETTDYPIGKVTGEVSVAPVFDDAGSCTHLVGAVHDITERRKLEAQFRQAQKMEAIGQLAGGVAHDFNNLLTAILGYADLLKDRLAADDSGLQDVEEIRKAGERAAGLTRQLLAFSRKQILQPTNLDVNVLVKNIMSMLRRLIGENIKLEANLQLALPPIKADPGQLEQVIMNLVVNARDAMPNGGKLLIKTATAEVGGSDRVHGMSIKPGNYLTLSISDTGLGMTPETQKQIFEPFFTTKGRTGGTGLGLATVYGIVKQSDGYIWVDSEPGRGATFTIYLPPTSGKVGTQVVRIIDQVRGGSETVLLVEDEMSVRLLTRVLLERSGYNVLDTGNPQEAAELVDRCEGPIDLLITDVVMPGLSGREVFSQVAARRPQIKALFMSGYTDDAIIRHGVLNAETCFLQKPFTAENLARKVREILDGASISSEA